MSHCPLLQAFFREAVVWKHLRHSNVIPFIGVYATPSEFNLISPWMANGDIISFLKANLDADWQNLVLDIVEGLSYIHGMELVHGDLKGANILINSRLEACLSDFGLTTALSASDAPLSTSSAVIAGSARWLAPELIYPRGDRRHTPSSDVYAFGVVLWEIITCRVPFDDIPRDETVMLRVSRGLRPCIHCLADFPSVGYGALRLFESCLKTDPSERPRMGDASVKEALFGTANLPHKITPTWAGRTWLVLPPVLGFAASLLLLATIPSFRLGACIIAGIFVLLGIRNALLSQFVVLTVYTSAPSTITSFYDGDIVVPSLHISATVMSTVILGVSFYLNFADIPPDWGPSESYVFSSRYLTGCSIALYAGLSAYHDANLVFALLKYRKGASIQSVYNIRPGTQLVVSVPPAVFPQDVRFVCELMGELEWMSYHEKSHHYFVQYKNDDDAEQALVDLVPQLETFTTLGQVCNAISFNIST
ncbi:hypothetical protein JAAARDRAFT_50223 [Jaapia argillacea MUCL 33604]|uniref:Protein kinase domain-containing protein n=1 Tax=Jaapia argillacea MUCL 33604 TaxID=933084 RepID=A0A067PCA7_9AGAM|nr:hypothetical protein JAAARDRAFT_50223 [Jaapia argillacea MUCL 33604]